MMVAPRYGLSAWTGAGLGLVVSPIAFSAYIALLHLADAWRRRRESQSMIEGRKRTQVFYGTADSG
jgi:hypothetical protein